MEIKNSQTTSIRASSTIPQIDWVMGRHYFYEEQKSKAPKFLGISFSVHVLILVAATFIAIPLLQKPEVETITIEITDSAPSIRKAQPRQQPQHQPQLKESAPRLEVAQKAKNIPQVDSIKPVASTLDDIQAQDLIAESKVQSDSNIDPRLLDQDLDNDLRVINKRHKKSLAQEKQKLMNQLMADEHAANQELAALERANAIKREKIAQANANRRAKDQAAVEALRAQEQAEAHAAAEQAAINAVMEAAAQQEAANRAAAERQANLEQAAQRRKQSLAAAAARDGYGGRASGVRDISELRQLPGNPRPQYESSERLQGQQGQVSFLAYITKEGFISKIKPLKQTGFSNLDQKSLDAVKRWKFYPGQEGWVEIPFSWDLKGGPQVMPTLLRRSFSQR